MKPTSQLPTLEAVRSALSYDPATGIFRWLKTSRRAIAGSVAGSIDNAGRVNISIGGRRIKASRLAWFYEFGRWPDKLIDHRDGNPLNNAIDNLREATFSQNAANAKSRGALPKGVVYLRKTDVYRAAITVNGKRLYLGQFSTVEDAANAYQTAARQYFGEFTRCL